MKLILNKIVAEFNKIFNGSKRVGDSLRVEGRRMSDLDVANSAKLGHKTESTLNVNHAVYSDNAEKIRSVGIDGEPDVNSNGDPVFKTENQLNVNSSHYVRGVEPLNMEVDIARRLKVGDQADSPIINVSSLVTHPSIYRVRDSGLLGGKTEDTLDVRRAVDADNADLLNNTPQNELEVEKARIATKLTTLDGQELKEEELRVYSSVNIVDSVGELYNLYGLRDYIIEHPLAKNIIPDLATTATHIAKPGSSLGYTFNDIMTFLKSDTSSEIYKSQRLITGDSNNPAKTGDELKTWIIVSDDFKNKVGSINAATADRAVKFGDSSTSYTVGQFESHIQSNITVDNATTAANANKLNNKTAATIVSDTRSLILTNAGNNLSDGEVNGFFGANKVKIAVAAIKPTNAGNSDTLESYTLAQIKQQIGDNGIANAARYLFKTSSGGQVTYTDITTDISNAITDLINGASNGYDTLAEIENIIKSNKTDIENSLTTETTNRNTADNSLQNNIDVEKGRVDTILSSSSTNFNTFSKAKTYLDNITGILGDLTTSETNNLVTAINSLEEEINSLESSSNSTSGNLGDEIDRIEAAVGLKTNGDYKSVTGDYILTADTLMEAVKLLDTALKNEETSRDDRDTTLQNNINTVNSNLSTEKTNRTDADNTLQTNIDNVASDLNAEETSRTAADDSLQDDIDANETAINNEISARTSADSTLNDSISTEVTNRTNADNTLQNNIDTVDGKITSEISTRASADNTLQDNIDTVTTNLNSEISDRTTADNNIKSTITSIKTGTGLNVDGDYVVNGSSNYLASATSLANADDKLDTAIKSEETSRLALETRLDTHKILLGGDNFNETTQTVNFNDTNYTDSETTLYDAVTNLDSMLGSTNNTLGVHGNTLNTLQTSISTEKSRIDAILDTADADKDSFVEIVDLINSVDTTNDTAFANYVLSNDDRSTTIETDISTEISDRTTADNTLQSNIDDVNNNISTTKLDKSSQLSLDTKLDSDILAVVGTRYYVNVSSGVITVTLPSDATDFDRVLIHGWKGDFSVNNLVITKDAGHTIMNKDEDLIVDTNDETFELVFIENDWRIL